MRTQTPSRKWSLGVATAALMLALVVILLAPASALAGRLGCQPVNEPSWVTQELQVAAPGADVGAPVTDGLTVVWADAHGGDFDLYAYDVAGGLTRTLVSGAGDQAQPAIAGGLVAYVDSSSGSPMVWAIDTGVDGAQPFEVSAAAGDQPATDGRYIVWTDLSKGSDGCDILAYDTTTQQIFTVCDVEGTQCAPAVSDGVVVWQDDRNGDWDIYGYDIAAQQEIRVAVGEADQTSPAIFSGIAVWQTNLYGNWDIDGAYLPGWSGSSDGLGLVRQGLLHQGLVRQGLVRTAALGCYPPESDGELFAVCHVWGDQTDPSIEGPMVAWTDGRDCGDTDIYAFDLINAKPFVVCDAEGRQTDPSVGNGFVTWLDGREGGEYPAVWGATWAAGGDQQDPEPTTEWTSDRFITLFLSVFNQLGIFTDVRFSFDGGTTWTDWQAFDDVDQVQLPAGDGPKTVSVQFRDGDGNETPVISFGVCLDSRGPVTKAPTVAHAWHGGTGLVRFRVNDAQSPKAAVTIAIRNRAGACVKLIRMTARRTNTAQVRRFKCQLKRGTYRYTVLATDLAGNRQVKAGSNRLLVR